MCVCVLYIRVCVCVLYIRVCVTEREKIYISNSIYIQLIITIVACRYSFPPIAALYRWPPENLCPCRWVQASSSTLGAVWFGVLPTPTGCAGGLAPL